MPFDPPCATEFPNWVPQSVARYVAHTKHGFSIRELARRDGCHASTVLRQIRKLETKRDDPMVDAALDRFKVQEKSLKCNNSSDVPSEFNAIPEAGVLRREGRRILARLCENGAVLAVAKGMENAVVVRDLPDGETVRTATVAQEIAQAMALKDWIQGTGQGKVFRYSITTSGRAALNRFIAEEANAVFGFGETQDGFDGPVPQVGDAAVKARFNTSESPLVSLARRKDRDGAPFLDTALVSAGERLREDFELARMSSKKDKAWELVLQGSGQAGYVTEGKSPTDFAKARVADALSALGEGLADVVLRCCCYLEGLETVEKRFGWSARSAKVVLRIALRRFRVHYESNAGGQGDYIG
ncbi:hypothetical protein BXY66_1354 [Shimia isoporae]|uniref:DUF6456 domain-containing protein n=1 Tax=Shimia isoporae TaxID=647720 RepID=A0A4R1NND5_9RHOB|nr:DUF6456 domain-containing protein [Shimia isoporae]TCL09309.1 hypothetical protein BXY66_1354 [Shimia isoporae]